MEKIRSYELDVALVLGFRLLKGDRRAANALIGVKSIEEQIEDESVE